MVPPPLAFAGLVPAFWVGMQRGDQALPSTPEGRQTPAMEGTALGFLAEMGNPFARIGADSGRMALDRGVNGVPETYVFDGKGGVVLRMAGPITAGNLESVIRPAMAKAE